MLTLYISAVVSEGVSRRSWQHDPVAYYRKCSCFDASHLSHFAASDKNDALKVQYEPEAMSFPVAKQETAGFNCQLDSSDSGWLFDRDHSSIYYSYF